MAWDPVSVIGGTEPLYFGPLAGYDTEELDRRGIDQDKKTTKGFKWMSEAATAKTKATSATSQEKQPLDPGPPSLELSQGLRSKKLGRDELQLGMNLPRKPHSMESDIFLIKRGLR